MAEQQPIGQGDVCARHCGMRPLEQRFGGGAEWGAGVQNPFRQAGPKDPIFQGVGDPKFRGGGGGGSQAQCGRAVRNAPSKGQHAELDRPSQVGRGVFVPAQGAHRPGDVDGMRRTGAAERDAAAVLESIGADLIFVLDPATEAFCAVEIQDPNVNTTDWAKILAALVQSKDEKPGI